MNAKPRELGHPIARLFPWALLVLSVCWLLLQARPPQPPEAATSQFNLNAFAELPVSYGGRIKPIDSVARNSLLILIRKQTYRDDEKQIDALPWLLDVMTRPQVADELPVFRIDHPDVLSLVAAGASKHAVSANEVRQHVDELMPLIHSAQSVPAAGRSSYQRSLVKLGEKLSLYNQLAQYRTLHMVPPPTSDHDWLTMPEAVAFAQQHGHSPLGAHAWATMLMQYSEGNAIQENAKVFNETLVTYQQHLAEQWSNVARKASLETVFNRLAPFHRGTVLYCVVGVLVGFSWLGFSAPLMRGARWLLLLTLALHTAALVARIYLSGRPPVTNLYSSAVFIGWGCVLLCVFLERIYRNGIGTLVAAMTGFLTLIIAHHLGRSGDTMAVLQAVLDTNLWLATHVVVVTLGYASTYLAGFLGIVYIARGMFTSSLSTGENKRMGQMIYGIICFALLFSFVGTLLGGLWADQSWGRFWGWDPKENGALLIVLWNALILHARWGGLARQRGLAMLAVFGNIVTTWSWFGTNMLGVGLHAYGFIDAAMFWLILFIVSQLSIIALASVPPRYWRSPLDAT